MEPNEIAQLKSELKELLKKYNVFISACVGDGSDTHGIYDESIKIFKKGTNEAALINISGWSIDENDLT